MGLMLIIAQESVDTMLNSMMAVMMPVALTLKMKQGKNWSILLHKNNMVDSVLVW